MVGKRATIKDLERKLVKLKATLGVMAILTLLFGGGGVIGVFKWLDSERELVTTQIKHMSMDSTISKFDAIMKGRNNQLNYLKSIYREDESEQQFAKPDLCGIADKIDDLERKIYELTEEFVITIQSFNSAPTLEWEKLITEWEEENQELSLVERQSPDANEEKLRWLRNFCQSEST